MSEADHLRAVLGRFRSDLKRPVPVFGEPATGLLQATEGKVYTFEEMEAEHARISHQGWMIVRDPEEVMGVKDQMDLARAGVLQKNWYQRHKLQRIAEQPAAPTAMSIYERLQRLRAKP